MNLLRKIRAAFGLVPPFAWPIAIAALLWFLVRRAGAESRAFDGFLFVATLIVCILVFVLGSRRETLNDRAAKDRLN